MTTASYEEQKAFIKHVEETWFFCGGQDTHSNHYRVHDDNGELDAVDEAGLETWGRLWRHHFPYQEMPSPTVTCICGKEGLRYNTYICNKEKTTVITIGRVCLKQFLPRQAKHMDAKRCEHIKEGVMCMGPHKNRKDNYCKACRVAIKEEERQRVVEEEREAKEREAKEREAKEREAKERERHAKEQERERRSRTCECGTIKRPEFPVCFFCHNKKVKEQQEKVSQMPPHLQKMFHCSCGKPKSPTFPTCWGCKPKA